MIDREKDVFGIIKNGKGSLGSQLALLIELATPTTTLIKSVSDDLLTALALILRLEARDLADQEFCFTSWNFSYLGGVPYFSWSMSRPLFDVFVADSRELVRIDIFSGKIKLKMDYGPLGDYRSIGSRPIIFGTDLVTNDERYFLRPDHGERERISTLFDTMGIEEVRRLRKLLTRCVEILSLGKDGKNTERQFELCECLRAFYLGFPCAYSEENIERVVPREAKYLLQYLKK